jgi:hypothetical protein
MPIPALIAAIVLSIIITELVWRFIAAKPKIALYIWIAAGAAWATLVGKEQIQTPGFQWQEMAWPFFSVILFMILFEVYKKLRRHS